MSTYLRSKKDLATVASVLCLLVCFCGLWLLYVQARGMTWQFDDYINLRMLGAVSTHPGLVDFVFGGVAGPMGRPLSLLTFVANYADWMSNPWGVAQLNLLFHCINGALAYLLARRLFIAAQSQVHAANWMAALAAGFWLILPIHASSILMPIQRMTQVSAFFLLLTLYGYMVLRARYVGPPSAPGVFAISAWVVCGTALSVLGKENGAVTVTLVGLIEVFFFRSAGSTSAWRTLWRAWVWLALLAVPAALAYHLVTQWGGIHGRFIHYRGYGMADHLATQAVISWEYVRQTLLPRAALLGPYHDGRAVHDWSMWQPYAAVLAWVTLLALCIGMLRAASGQLRRAGKWLLFVVLWFFACHQIESTFIPLELYFEHRNYVAVLGLCCFMALVIGELWQSVARRKLVALAMAGLTSIQVFGLQQITSLWGQPMLANEMWALHNPGSARATQALANDLLLFGFRDAALRLSDEFVARNNAVDVAIQFFPKHCEVANELELRRRFDAIRAMVPQTVRPGGIPTGLAKMGQAIRGKKCIGISSQEYIALLDLMLQNSSIRWQSGVRHHLNYEMALTQLAENNLTQYAKYAKQAFYDYPSLSIAQSIALVLFKHGELEQALEWLDTVLARAPNMMLRQAWTDQLTSMRAALREVLGHLQGEPQDEQVGPLERGQGDVRE